MMTAVSWMFAGVMVGAMPGMTVVASPNARTTIAKSPVAKSAVTATEVLTYDQAYEAMHQSGRPLLVLVGAEWCPACKVMKNATLKDINRAGGLAEVSYAVVDFDVEPQLARQLLKGQTIPQLILFTKTTDGKWQRQELTGKQVKTRVEGFVVEGIASHSNTPISRTVSATMPEEEQKKD